MHIHHVQHWLSSFGLYGVFIGVLGEALMLPLPSETLVTIGSVAASKGIYPYWLFFLVSFIGSYFGSIIGYWIGRIIGKAALHRIHKKLKIPDKYILDVEKKMVRYSAPLFVVYRFLPVVRGILPYIAGANLLPFRSFAWLSAIGSVLWVFTFAVFGTVVAKTMRFITHFNLHVIITVIFVALITGYTGYRLGLAKKQSADD